MGHTRLGEVPKGQKWKTVVGVIAGEGPDGAEVALAEDIAAIAHRTLDAAQAGIDAAMSDRGLCYTFYLLAQVLLASREQDWVSAMREAGLSVPQSPSLFDITSSVQNAVDDYLASRDHPTDISEMAQLAAGEALAETASPRAQSLFGTGPEEVRSALRELSTNRGFGQLGQRFFGVFLSRYLNFYLSRATSAHVGGRRVRDVGDVSALNDSLRSHCIQSAAIVREFCGGWLSKTNYEQGINRQNVSRFVSIALRKLRDELQKQQAES